MRALNKMEPKYHQILMFVSKEIANDVFDMTQGLIVLSSIVLASAVYTVELCHFTALFGVYQATNIKIS